ncbi:hypothetical protein DV515_00013223 [Chloebia gouldiae]|uniref:G-protein coupled receptors family 1 profile domain-containing protein n=1 Tax=Chloebia gouldiae TaxID=44316 RepID=A0A3L8S1D2_CHLGU|nr:hypothetical protein DV515_00013223 [Chloebia gouldiae]
MFNSSTNSSGNNCSHSTVITTTVIPLLYCFIFLAGLSLNALAAWVFLYVSSTKSFIVYLKNIAVADLLMSLTFPFKILADSGIAPAELSLFVCRYSAVVFYMNMYIGISFFGLIGFDRYYKIVKPLFTSFVHTVNYSKVVSVIIWLLLMIMSFPNMILTNEITKDNYSRKLNQLTQGVYNVKQHFECHLYEEMEPFTYFYYLIFLVGIIGSCFALWAFTQKDQKQKCMSIYLINLLTADFLLTLTLPVKIIVDLGIASWNLRIFHCQVTACFIYLNMYLSITFLGLVSMDRCLQLMHSSKICRVQEPGFAKTLSAVVWATVLLITVPNTAIPIKHIEERHGAGCIDFKTKFGRDWHVFTNFICTAIFLNSSAVILICGGTSAAGAGARPAGDGRVPAVPRALPRRARALHAEPGRRQRQLPLRRALFKAKECTLLLAVSNLCFDPLLYYRLSKAFRLKLAEALAAPQEMKAQQPRAEARPGP